MINVVVPSTREFKLSWRRAGRKLTGVIESRDSDNPAVLPTLRKI